MIRILCLIALLSPLAAPAGEPAASQADSVYFEYEMEPIVVTGMRSERRLADSPVATELILREELAQSGAESVADFLENQAGVVISHSIFGSGLQLQGLGSDYVLVLVDGERAVGRKNGVIDLSRYSLDNIDRIEVVKGNQSALYGSEAIGGVLNIITRRADSPLELDGHFRVLGQGDLDIGGSAAFKGERWTSRLTGGWRRNDPYDMDESDPETSVDGFDEASFVYNNQIRLGGFHRLEGRFSYLRRNVEAVDGGTLISPTIFDRSNVTEIVTASLAPKIWVGETGSWRSVASFSMYRDEYTEDQRDGDFLDQYSETWERMVQFSSQYDRQLFDARHMMSLGVELFHEDLETERLENGKSDRQRLGLFLQDEWILSRDHHLTAVPGLRFDGDTQFGRHFTPKITLRHDLRRELILRGSLGMGFRAPDFKELYIRFSHPAVGYEVIGNPDLEPELSRSASLGFEWHAHERIGVTANAFAHDFDNLIQGIITDEESSPGMLLATYVNVQAATIRGVEATLRLRPLTGLRCELGYTYLDTRDEATGNVLDGRSRHRGNFNLSYRWDRPGITFTTRGSLVGERSFSEAYSGVETRQADPYTLVDIELSKNLGGRLNVSLGVDNLLDEGDHEYLRISPRRFIAGIDLQYRNEQE